MFTTSPSHGTLHQDGAKVSSMGSAATGGISTIDDNPPLELLILCIQYALDGINWTQRGLKVGNQPLPHLAYANDIVLLASVRAESAGTDHHRRIWKDVELAHQVPLHRGDKDDVLYGLEACDAKYHSESFKPPQFTVTLLDVIWRGSSPPWPHLQPISAPPPPCQFGRRTPSPQPQAKRQPRGRGYAVYRNQTPPRPGSPSPQAGPSGIPAAKRVDPPQDKASDSPKTTEEPYNKELVVNWLKDSSDPQVIPPTHLLAPESESGQSSTSSCEIRSASTVGWTTTSPYAKGMDVNKESLTKSEARAKSPGRACSGLVSAFQSPAEGDSWSANMSFVDAAIRRVDAATADAKKTKKTIRTALLQAAPPSKPCSWPEL
uniref:Reverse transcriptase domain-containing protein n=1 Tax=Plectus sambesii TaxID=2011161 RepID=A0A914XHE5_9BILA